MLPVKQAEEIILSLVQPLDNQQDTKLLALSSAFGNILAAPVTSQLDFPHWDNSAMDGYAVRFADVESCNAEQPAVLDIVEEIPAGQEPQSYIQPGQAARIFTGAVMPAGADTVVMQEETIREGKRVKILAAPKPQDFVRFQGAFYKAGSPLLPAGIKICAPEIAVLAAAQCTQLSVYRRPRLAIFSTGNELVTPEQPLQPGQIVDSNQYALTALVEQMGGEALSIGIIPDRPEAIAEAIAQAVASADMVISSGGVSVGDYDYVDRILAQLGAQIHLRAVGIKPGKPLTFATFSDLANNRKSVLYFGLPGNPVSSMVSFWRFVQPAFKKLSGLAQGWEPQFVLGRSRHDLRSDGKRESYFWGKLQLVDGVYEFQLASGSQNSANLINLAQTTGMAVLPVGEKFIPAGEQVKVLAIS